MKKPTYKATFILSSALFLLNVLVITIFCIKPGIQYLSPKLETRDLVDTTEQRFISRSQEIMDIKADLVELEPYLEKLESAIPTEHNLDKYLIDFIIAVSGEGFLVEKFVPVTTPNERIEIAVTLSGNQDRLHLLISEIEKLERLTTVQSVKIKEEKGTRVILIKVSVYKTGEAI